MKDNKLIAEFMELEASPKYNPKEYYIKEYNSGEWYLPEEMQYHTSWDWLMPVLKKINSEISPNTRGLWRMIINPTEYDIENVYSQAVYFINEYNKQEL